MFSGIRKRRGNGRGFRTATRTCASAESDIEYMNFKVGYKYRFTVSGSGKSIIYRGSDVELQAVSQSDNASYFDVTADSNSTSNNSMFVKIPNQSKYWVRHNRVDGPDVLALSNSMSNSFYAYRDAGSTGPWTLKQKGTRYLSEYGDQIEIRTGSGSKWIIDRL